MQSDEIKLKIKKIFSELFMIDIMELDDLKDDEVIINGRLGFDSLMTIRMILLLEEYFEIIIEDEEITQELFESVNSIAALVERKLVAADARS